MASEVLPQVVPFVLPFDGTWPQFLTEPRLCGADASVLGKVRLGARASLGAGTVIRGDGHFVRIGDDFHLGEMSTVHIAHDVYPAIVGDRVAVGRDAVVHACTVGNDCVIEDGVVILDGSVVEDGVLIEARSTVFPRSTLKSGFAYSGSPAKPIRELAPGELEQRAQLLHEAVAASLFATTADAAPDTGRFPADAFVATTARLVGAIELGACASVFFGCRLDAALAPITIGENSNVQDNTRIDASEGAVIIGPDTTIGHNVHIRAGRIGAHALIGIGADLGAGTIVDDDVLLAAGSVTTPRQHLEGGWLWGGRPARPIARLDENRRAAMRDIIRHYRAYGAAYRAAQDRPAGQGGSNGTSPIADRHPHR
ncbi:gamma carbonic anhydrase family protein [Bosea sp. 117]|uniref:gamma carbonic anhydrase family protein n=1 Tax=Bosea sp. 117 TaxID=1125973 RepID=UPI00068E6079|nr:gamma carbonic anhydrase family protein [Bosea sp. 117]